uniref:Uncharacterized protein n=1 Tax=Octopus bimaculoides TaxID=37653 RepID=A0A0L8GLM9_OCTBM
MQNAQSRNVKDTRYSGLNPKPNNRFFFVCLNYVFSYLFLPNQSGNINFFVVWSEEEKECS